MTRGSLAVKGRMLAALGAVVALNAAFVLVVAWLYLVLLPTIFAGGYLWLVDGSVPAIGTLAQLPMAVHWLALLTVAFLAGQVYYGYTRVLDDVRTGAVGPEEYPQLHGIVGRLANAADVPKPSVSVVAAERPNSFTIGRGHAATLVVTEPLLSLLDEDELEAVLAHEIAHVRHRDVTLMTVTGLFVAIAERTLHSAQLLRRGITAGDRQYTRQQLAFDWLFPLVLFTYVFVAPVLYLFPPVARFASGELSRQREFAADRAAANLTGAPTALARALIQVHEATPDVAQTDLRHDRSALRALCVVPSGLSDLAGREDDRVVEPGAPEHGTTARWIGAPARDVEPSDEASDAASWAPASDDADASTGDSSSPHASSTPGDTSTGESNAPRTDGPEASASTGTGASSIDPEQWLGTTRSTDASGAHTHPPIERRVERLVEMEA